MYKIYINDTPLLIVKSENIKNQFPPSKEVLVAPYTGKTKSLMNYIDVLEKPHKYTQIVLHTNKPKKCFKDFKSLYKTIKAAGGLVFLTPKKEKILVIHRRGYYDLPKGKIDPDENSKAAALREVNEETGVRNLKLGKKVTTTYHTYRDPRKNRRVLKKTNWYLMSTSHINLIPQAEEDIDDAFWITPDDFLSVNRKVYGNILEVIHKGKEMVD